ncbi:major facilitator family transporter protein [Listeria floridensis FSL S10-1187]|uniref:Major facilitator family transporter protein n=1 Tax=Listeria floridensis FSL S10-1187 TaxID=1265817 RepID=A0ABP3AY78_9LIST|nr:MFS transporter [Listeria floridensis]EUJ28501.1 major facilitator family transporter protein [Listeria floridensis FSL S10-1187]
MAQQQTSENYKGTNRLVFGIVFGVLTFWLFAQSMVNIVPAIQKDIGISSDLLNIAISLTALFSGIFIVVAGGMADKFGRMKLTYIGFILSIIGSLLIVLSHGAALLIIGRIVQGLSAACIMPATLSLMKTYFDGKDRQRALSYWSIGSWGGSGFCSFIGGAIATYMGWRWIFIISIIVALLGMLLIKGTPESKVIQTANESKGRFDIGGLLTFIIAMVCLNLVITRGSTFGWTSLTTIIMTLVFLVSAFLFFRIELRQANGFIDFSLFKNKAYSGATLSNFLLNAAAGTLVVANTYVQVGRGFTSFQSGLLTLGYVICVLAMIRVGEKLLQKIGARKPMIFGSLITAIGIAMMALTFLPDVLYIIFVFIGYALFGLGLGVYATPSTDTAVSNSPEDKVGVASGIYKMASSLGGSFGVAISATVYGVIAASGNVEIAAMVGLLTNVAFCVLSFLAVVFMTPRTQKVAQKLQANE